MRLIFGARSGYASGSMPKLSRIQKKDEYIRFRPYHVFGAKEKQNDQRTFARVLFIVAVVGLILGVGVLLALQHH